MEDRLLTAVKETAAQYDMFPRGGRVLAAVSGGLDSMCLLHALCALAPAGGFSVSAAHFNHHLRGTESDRDQAFVRRWCAEHRIPLTEGGADVAAEAARCHAGTEETARRLRYRFLEELARTTGARIATAHTADDQAETLLLNLTRGAGLTGLGGIPPVRGAIIRPLLALPRSEVEAYAQRHAIPHVEDSSNASDDYSRNRIRHHVIPVLRSINPEFSLTAARSAALLRRDSQWLEEQAALFVKTHLQDGRLPADALQALPYPIASRVIRQLADRALTARHVDAVLSLCRSDCPSAAADLPGMRVRREYGALVFDRPADPPRFSPFVLAPGDTVDCGELGLRFTCQYEKNGGEFYKSFNNFVFKYETICGKITVRPRLAGEKIRLAHHRETKSVKKLFMEARIPAEKRDRIPILADDLGPLAIYGLGMAARARAQRGDSVIKIKIEEISDHDGK